jgi:hypothetical protein
MRVDASAMLRYLLLQLLHLIPVAAIIRGGLRLQQQ